MKTRLSIILALLFICTSAKAQSNELELMVIAGGAGACERNAASFDNLATLLLSSEERLFVVARLGGGENSRDLNRRRLHNVTLISRTAGRNLTLRDLSSLKGIELREKDEWSFMFAAI